MDVREGRGGVEDQVRPAPIAPARAVGAASGWIVSPAYDLFFLANIAWLALLLPGLSSRSHTVLAFWQVYFPPLPHGWLALGLVLAGPDRRGGRGRRLTVVALAAAVVVVGVYLGTGALTCLAVVDYAWNAWHFAAQHAGVLRMYSRK